MTVRFLKSDGPVLLASFQRLVFERVSIKAFSLPTLDAASTPNEPNSFSSICELSPTPLNEVYVICEKSKLWLSEILFVST
jgi:hypothetical protein